MEQKKPLLSADIDSIVSVLKYVLSFFMIMLMTYVICTVNEGSVAFAFTFAVSAGILALLVCHALSEGGVPKLRHYYIWMAALLSFCAIAICYTALGVYPFGEKSVMIIDMHHQYSSFFSLVREKIWSLDSLSYSDSVGMGGGLLPLIAYYLCSPFNIIALLFPRDNLTEAIALIEVLKITAAGATFAVFCKGVFKKEDYGSVGLSVAYALSAYFIAYSWDVMWLDCLVLLPLIVYGLEKVLNGGSPLLYSISLGLAVTTNYYIGYMLCVFMVLWFLMRTIERDDFYRGQTAEQKALTWLKKLLRFAWTSAVGGLLSMWILIPTAISLRETSGAEDQFARDVKENFDFWDIFSRTLYGSTPTERGDNLPNIYCSLLAVFLVALFLLCRKIRLRTRVCFGGLLGVLVLLLANNWTNFAFHGFHFPNDLPYRNSFLISFVMLAIAAQALDRVKDMRREDLFRAFAVVAALLVIEQKFGKNDAYAVIWTSLGFLIGYTVLLSVSVAGKNVKKGAVAALVMALVFTEVATNAAVMIHTLDENEVFTERENFVSDYDANKAAVSFVESINRDGSRMELLPRKTCNDNALYDYPGLTVFASSNAKVTTTLMGKLGYAINGVNSYIYNSYVPLVDSVLNLKYVTFHRDIGTHAQLAYIDKVSDSDGNYRYIYENTLALSRGFLVDNDIVYWNSNNTARYENPFEVQNKFVEYAVGGAPVYRMLTPEVESADNMDVEFNESYFYAESGGGSGSFTALHVTETEAQSYIYVDCRAASSINVSIDNSNWSVTPYEPYIIDLGRLAVGTEVRVSIDADSTCSGNVFLAEMDTEALYAAIGAMGENQWQISEYRNGYFKGSITAPQAGVMFTSIPYNEGWTVTVDGKSADVVTVGDAMIGVVLPEGTHEIVMKYHTSGFPIGVVCTLLGIAALVLWSLRKKIVYPLLREYVPVLYPYISEVREPKPALTDSPEAQPQTAEEVPVETSREETASAEPPVPVTVVEETAELSMESPQPPISEIRQVSELREASENQPAQTDKTEAVADKVPHAPQADKAEQNAKNVTDIKDMRNAENPAVFQPVIAFQGGKPQARPSTATQPEPSQNRPSPQSVPNAKKAPIRQVTKPAEESKLPVNVPSVGTPEVFEITEDNRGKK